ncbi:MAG: hypothetical protein ACC645_23460 [Pirellulales bacterium]
MTYRFQRKTMNLLLSALVLAWGIVPPGFQHAHEGGSDTAHRHDSRHEVIHHDSHHHDTEDAHHEHATLPEVSRLGDYVVHLHWLFLDMDFSMPVPEEPVDGGDDDGTVPTAFVRVMNEMVPATHAGSSFVRMLQAAICMPGVDVVSSLEPIPHPSNLVTSLPLCDSARLERSGVLLI